MCASHAHILHGLYAIEGSAQICSEVAIDALGYGNFEVYMKKKSIMRLRIHSRGENTKNPLNTCRFEVGEEDL